MQVVLYNDCKMVVVVVNLYVDIIHRHRAAMEKRWNALLHSTVVSKIYVYI